MTATPRLVVLGMMGRIPLAGVAWQVLHYLEGFRRLGFAVYYVEDTGDWPYDPEQNTITDDPTYAVNYIGALMARYGFADRWAYRAAARGGHTFGLSASRLSRLLEEADGLVNLTGSTRLRDEHRQVPVRIYLETDPVLPQIEVASGNTRFIELLAAHTHHFSYGENLGAPDCLVPVERFDYRPTRQPVVLDWWAPATPPTRPTSTPRTPCFTTIANWRQGGKDVVWRGETYTWSKHHEFLKFIDLPRRTTQALELALALQGQPGTRDGEWIALKQEDAEATRLLTSQGWRITNGMRLSRDIVPYRDYILASRGEFTVAKDQNVRLRSGWFSDRSACYLAAGRPVITQDTAFDKVLPTGEGLFAFNSMDQILAALETINADYERHRRAARAIAEEHFRAETVLARLLEESGLEVSAS
jgi:hypothetical protein